jgi:hypothetical protein
MDLDFLVFLDIDGVLNANVSGRAHGPHVDDRPVIERSAVRSLNLLMARAPARTGIVISSAWRNFRSLKSLATDLRAAGFKYSSRILGITPNGSSRRNEIERFLVLHGWPARKSLILDDERDFGKLESRHVWTNHQKGLCEKDVERAVRLFGDR